MFTSARDKAAWDWTLLVLVPDWVPAELLEPARSRVTRRRRPARLDDVRLETLHEGRCLQTLHVGSFDDEGPVLARMHDEEIPGRGLRMRGRHHEVYLGDPPPRRARADADDPAPARRPRLTTHPGRAAAMCEGIDLLWAGTRRFLHISRRSRARVRGEG